MRLWGKLSRSACLVHRLRRPPLVSLSLCVAGDWSLLDRNEIGRKHKTPHRGSGGLAVLSAYALFSRLCRFLMALQPHTPTLPVSFIQWCGPVIG